MSSAQVGTSREPSSTRFAGPEHLLDLDAALASLRREPHAAKDSHRQITVFHHGPLRLVLFAFEAGGHLREHRVPGVVVMRALKGTLRVRTPLETYELMQGKILVLDPDVPHDVEAREPADMLLSVALVPRARNGSEPNAV